MHELGLASEVAATLLQVMEEEKLSVITEVTLSVGEATGVVPRFMIECWPAVIDETPLAGSTIKVNTIRVIGRCHDCENEFIVSDHNGVCPKCGCTDYDMTNGYEFEIAEIKGH